MNLDDPLTRLAQIRRGVRGVSKHPAMSEDVRRLLARIDQELDMLEVDMKYVEIMEEIV